MAHILVVKLGALGDFIQATAAFADIRAHHNADHITLLTTPPMLPFANNSPFFDAISIDERKSMWNIPYIIKLQRKLKGFDMVYDLQTNDRTQVYFWLAGKPKWCGIAKGCKYKHTNPNRNNMHSLTRITDQLKTTGIISTNTPNISYASKSSDSIFKSYGLTPNKTIALIPGGSAHRPGKRWPHFIELANNLASQGYQVILIGSNAEAELLNQIAKQTSSINLCGKTSIGQLIDLFSKIRFVIGNDTGPMHIAAASKAKGVVLFGADSNPSLCAPKTKGFSTLHKSSIDAISPQEVLELI